VNLNNIITSTISELNSLHISAAILTLRSNLELFALSLRECHQVYSQRIKCNEKLPVHEHSSTSRPNITGTFNHFRENFKELQQIMPDPNAITLADLIVYIDLYHWSSKKINEMNFKFESVKGIESDPPDITHLFPYLSAKLLPHIGTNGENVIITNRSAGVSTSKIPKAIADMMKMARLSNSTSG
jgi:hypothetical protein